MKRFRIALVATLALLTAATVGAAGGNEEVDGDAPVRIAVLGNIQTGNRQAVEDVLTPIWRERTNVVPEIVSIPTGSDYGNWLQIQIVADTLPDVIGMTNGIFDAPDRRDLLRGSGKLREITLEMLEEHMPLTAQRWAEYGFTMEDWYNANKDARDGKLWYVPSAPDANLNPNYRGTRFAQQSGTTPYYIYLRDDILTDIFPNVRTEAELRDLYFERNGDLTPEDVFDVPIRNREELYNYLQEVQRRGYTTSDGQSIIPGLPFSNESPGSLMWSNFTMAGYWWAGKADRPSHDGNDTMVYFAGTPEWKEYIRWLNRAFNEGLIDPEAFIQKDDQRNAKVINGQYAAFQFWLPVNDARRLAEAEGRGYGFRMVPTFLIPLETRYQDNFPIVYSLSSNWGAVGLTTSLDEELIPDVLRWIDWNYSKEAAELRAWGTPEMYAGDGPERRFTQEYAELESYMVAGEIGERDGPYYGLFNPTADPNYYFNHETHGIGSSGSFNYVWHPRYVYPTSEETFNVDVLTLEMTRRYYNELRLQETGGELPVYVEVSLGEDALAAQAAFDEIAEEWNEIRRIAGYNSDQGQLATIKAITGLVADFERNYAEYEATLTDELFASIEAQREAYHAFRDLYWTYVQRAE